MPKKGKQSSIKSSEYSVGYSEGAGPKSTTRPGEQRDQKKRRAGSGTAPGKRKRLLKPGYYEAVVSAAKLTLTPTGDREITVDLYVPHASGKRFEVATGADYRKFCQAAATEEQQWDAFDASKVVGARARCFVVVDPPNDRCPHSTNAVDYYLSYLF